LLVGCRGNAKPQALTVYAAASLTDVFAELGEAFKAEHPGVELTFNFASSSQLAQQLAQGAPADVFASANLAQMEVAITAGRVTESSAHIFARNRLVVVYPRDNPAGLAYLQDLARPGLKLVLAASEVPVGAYSLQFLDQASAALGFGEGYRDSVLANVVSYEETVRAVYSKVALGEADAGIVYATDIPKENPEAVGMIQIPEALNVVAEYPIAAVGDSANPSLASDFVAFVLSPPGQETLEAYGFTPVE
jgi:molybdate transport system substrate-binding protein